jgi:Tryptophan-associated transmembrane protein (Trp_oprn_chp)
MKIMRGSRHRPVMRALLAVIGGVAVVAGSLLAWVNADGGVVMGSTPVTGTPNGSDLLLGQVALGAGIAVAVIGLSLLAFGRARRVLGLLVLVGGIVATGTAAYVASDPQDRYIDFATDTAAPAGHEDEVRASLNNLFSVSNLTADPGIGSYVAIGGGAVAALGGLGALFGRKKSKADAEAEAKAEATMPPSADLEEAVETPVDQGPVSPVHGVPDRLAGAVEESPDEPQETSSLHEPERLEEPSAPQESPPEEPPVREERNPDEWSF